jgi:hypothetical protein
MGRLYLLVYPKVIYRSSNYLSKKLASVQIQPGQFSLLIPDEEI